MARKSNTVEDFWGSAKKRGNGCWEWEGRKNEKGYGYFSLDWKEWRAPRLAYFLTYGEIPQGMSILHECDNPSCINPEHLFLGTHLDNMADKIAKRRGVASGIRYRRDLTPMLTRRRAETKTQ